MLDVLPLARNEGGFDALPQAILECQRALRTGKVGAPL
jgi:hypothetical protein